MALWSTLFLEKWKRRESELRFCWDMHNYKAREPERVMYTGTFTLNPITKSVMMFDSFTTFKRRLIAELPIILFGFAIVALVFYTFFLWSRMYKGNQIMGIVIGSLNGATITIMSTLYKVQYLSDHSSFVNVSYNGRIIDLIVNSNLATYLKFIFLNL
jgi:anoctamin-10